MRAPDSRVANNTGQGKPLLVVGGAALGTMFEWYDFFLYGSLASHIARHFFAGVNEGTAFIFALAAFAVGFAVRPLGALVFGRLGDLVGRKRTFLVTLAIMGLATFMVGLLPGFATIGVAAPILLVALRLLQGLAIGGEYGGAAVYVAEHAPAGRRGLHTSCINVMATGGLIFSLLVIIGFRLLLSEQDFQAWGWRLPFLVSSLLLAISLWIRLKLGESPVFAQMQADDTVSRAPLAEAFGRWANVKLVLLALVAVVGGTTTWYSAHFYALFFLERVLKVEGLYTNVLMAIALALAAPAYLLFGWLSDRVGRKPIMLTGMVLAAVSLFPAFHMLTAAANPALVAAQSRAPVVVHADASTCSVQFDPIGRNSFNTTGCDIAKSFLSRAGVSYRNVGLAPGAQTEVHVGEQVIRPPDRPGPGADQSSGAIAAFQAGTSEALRSVGYPGAADLSRLDTVRVVAVVAYLVLLSAMVYAPAAAFLVELFPARIRYSSISLPYHLASGWFGGFLPASAFAIVAASGNIYAGLWYPVACAGTAAVICLLLLPETRGRSIGAETK